MHSEPVERRQNLVLPRFGRDTVFHSRKTEIEMGGIQYQNSPTPADSRPRIKTASLLSFLCGSFIIFLVCQPIFQGRTTPFPVFGLYWESGSAAARGANPYAAYPEEPTAHLNFLGGQRAVLDLNLNPPCMLPVFQALSHLSPQRFSLAWSVGSFLLLLATVALLMWHRPDMQIRQIFWLLLAAPVFNTLYGGELYFLLFLLAALALVFVERDHQLAAATAIGLLVAIKPTAVFWPLFLYLAGHRKLALRSLGVTLAVSAAPILFYGPSIYREWLTALENDPHWIFVTNIAIPAFFARLGLPSLGLLLAGTLAAFLAWAAWKTKPAFTNVSGVALCAAILCAPLAWVSYALMVAPYFVSHRWKLSSTVAAVLLTVPSAVPMMMSRSAGQLWAILGSGIYFAALWIILASFSSRDLRSLRDARTHCAQTGTLDEVGS